MTHTLRISLGLVCPIPVSFPLIPTFILGVRGVHPVDGPLTSLALAFALRALLALPFACTLSAPTL